MTPVVMSVTTAVRQCKVDADFYRLQIFVQKMAPPRDVEQLVQISPLWPELIRGSIIQLDQRMRIGMPELQQYRCDRVSEHISLFKGRGTAKADKILVLVFGGVGGFPFVPSALLLQHFPDQEFDIVILRDPRRVAFAMGLQNHSGSFAEMMRMLDREFGFAAYKELRTIGTSGGGAAALAAAASYDVSVAAAFCGRVPTGSTRYGETAAAEELERLVREAGRRRTRFILAHGADVAQDRKNTNALAELLPAPVIAIKGIADHNVFWELHRESALNPFFKRIGLVPAEPA